MNVVLRSALIVDPQSPHHGKKRDVLLRSGRIEKIASRIPGESKKEIRAKGLSLSPGWIDLRANFREPGDEQKETLESGSRAARAGGFSRVVMMPDTFPVVDNRASVEFLHRREHRQDVQLYATGSLSKAMEGRQLAELFDMREAGAVAFTDCRHPVSTELMVRALEYSKTFGGLIMTCPYDPGVNPGAMMHEGPTSTSLGMKGMSSLSEELRLHRDLRLLNYCGGRMHVSLISTSGSVDLIRKAKKEGLQVTCGVAAHQLVFSDEDLAGFDANLKVFPPFRSLSDRKALITGLLDGTIDAICSDHSPEDHEHKVVEWEYAAFGISGIQTAAAVAWRALRDKMPIEDFVARLVSGPASVLSVQTNVIDEGMPAEVTAFAVGETQLVSRETWQSKGLNSPFFGQGLPLRIYPVH